MLGTSSAWTPTDCRRTLAAYVGDGSSVPDGALLQDCTGPMFEDLARLASDRRAWNQRVDRPKLTSGQDVFFAFRIIFVLQLFGKFQPNRSIFAESKGVNFDPPCLIGVSHIPCLIGLRRYHPHKVFKLLDFQFCFYLVAIENIFPKSGLQASNSAYSWNESIKRAAGLPPGTTFLI